MYVTFSKKRFKVFDHHGYFSSSKVICFSFFFYFLNCFRYAMEDISLEIWINFFLHSPPYFLLNKLHTMQQFNPISWISWKPQLQIWTPTLSSKNWFVTLWFCFCSIWISSSSSCFHFHVTCWYSAAAIQLQICGIKLLTRADIYFFALVVLLCLLLLVFWTFANNAWFCGCSLSLIVFLTFCIFCCCGCFCCYCFVISFPCAIQNKRMRECC